MWVRLIFENSTVCLIVDELVCFAPLASGWFVIFFGWWAGWVLMVSLAMNSDIFVGVCFLSGDVALFSSCWLCLWVWLVWGVCFSMESLILAQDERWRRA